jgi:hypothetical protein
MPPTGAPLEHPVLGIPYGVWVVIATQEMSGVGWYHEFDLPKLMLIEKMWLYDDTAWVMQRRDPANPKGWQRVVRLKRP